MLVCKDRLKNTEEEVLQGKLSLIDLAGSERGTVTENRGIRLREGAKINTSLLALANCINALGDKSKKGFFVPFRDSKLTRLLKDSLGGNCKTVMITTIAPSSKQYEETINSLKYANRAKNIKMRVEPNKKLVSQHISAYKNIIADLRDEIDKLKSQLQQDIANKANPMHTKHTGMYPRASTNAANELGTNLSTSQYNSQANLHAFGDNLTIDDAKINASNSKTPGVGSSQKANVLGAHNGSSASPGRLQMANKFSIPHESCQCAVREKDEEQKQKVMEEVHIAYEEIL